MTTVDDRTVIPIVSTVYAVVRREIFEMIDVRVSAHERNAELRNT